jgi:hypothetical protein
LRAAAPGLRLIAVIVALGVPLACDGTIEGDGADPITDRSGALVDPNDPNNPEIAFKYWSQLPVLNSTAGDPAITHGSTHVFIAFQRGINGRYWGIAGEGPQNGSWGSAAFDTRSFASNPAIAHLPDVNGKRRVMVVGRGNGSLANDRRLFWAYGEVGQTNPPAFDTPARIGNFEPIGTTTFNGSYGYPAITSAPNGDVFMAYVALNTSNQLRVYAQRKPYNQGWQPRVTGPAIPCCYTTIGTPTVTWGYPGSAPQLMTILVRVQDGSNVYFRRIFFNGTSFQDVWADISMYQGTPAIQSEPAVEWNDELSTHTVYYRSGTGIYQASFYYNYLFEIPKKIVAAVTPSFAGAPAVNGNVQFEHGKHWVLARESGTGRLWFSESFPDSQLQP